MKKLNKVRIEYHTSKYYEYEGYRTSDWIESYSDVTLRELFDYAYSEIECSTFGIARIYDGKYQLGTVTKGKNGMNTFYTNYGKKLNCNKDY